MKIIRKLLSQIILFIDWITSPTPLKRSAEAQSQVDESTKRMSLYQFHGCPFCVKVRRKMKALSLKIELRDAMNDPKHRQDLIDARGRAKVPVLRIDHADGKTEWMPESSDINDYLEKRFLSESDRVAA